MIGIINYGLGNIKAFANIYKWLNIPFVIVSKANELADITKLILPGVGSFDQAMERLQGSGLRPHLERMVLGQKFPVIGICVGMQILTRMSEEGQSKGLAWVGADTKKFKPSPNEPMCIPHMGWNEVVPLKNNHLFNGLNGNPRFYFLHSYYVECRNSEDVLAVTTYGKEFACAINKENILGVQFHPEKSHRNGVQLLKNFSEL